MIIQKATIEDLPKILDLQKLCYQENAQRYNDFCIQPLQQTLIDLEREFEDNIFLKMEIDLQIVGSIRANQIKNECRIAKLMVHPEYQNRGYGTLLLKEIENHFNNALRYELFTGFKDEKNIYIYTKMGYKTYGEESLHDNFKMIYMQKENVPAKSR
jgi:GNAT superfamily N-acetyltransferase